MTNVPSNLIPTTITSLPEFTGSNTAGFFPYVLGGVTFKVQFSNLASVGAVPSTRTITGGSGLTGGGDLSADRVISIAAGGVGFSQLADSGVAAGAYGDAANIPVLTVDVKGRVTIASTTPINLTGFVPTSRAILAGSGLTGGGTLTTDRTISLALSTALPESGGTPSAGTATVAARENHAHPAVDLSDATETSGALPMSRGGTGSSLSPAAGAILYSDGSNVDLSDAGTAEQLFFSQGGAAPIFRSLTGGTTGLTFALSGSPYVLGGTLAVANGGTNATTVSGARVNLLPDYTGNGGKVLALNGGATDIEWLAISGTGTVTSVDLTAGTGISVAGGPITTSGSITVTNTAPDQVVSLTGAGTSIVTGTYPSFTVTSNDAFAGTVTSVSGTGAVSGLTLSGVVTTAGSLTLGGTLAVTPSNFASQTAATFLAAPTGAAGVPTFRAVAAADIPTLNQNTTGTSANVTGIVAVANGGTGQTTYTNGQLLIGNATGGTLVQATLTAGTNVSITNGAGAITINSTDQFVGTVTSVSGTGTVNGITLTGTVTNSGSLTLGGTLSGVSLTTQVSGTLPVASGGTNAVASPTAGAVAHGTGTAYAFTAAGTAGQVLVSNGASAPAFGGIDGGTF